MTARTRLLFSGSLLFWILLITLITETGLKTDGNGLMVFLWHLKLMGCEGCAFAINNPQMQLEPSKFKMKFLRVVIFIFGVSAQGFAEDVAGTGPVVEPPAEVVAKDPAAAPLAPTALNASSAAAPSDASLAALVDAPSVAAAPLTTSSVAAAAPAEVSPVSTAEGAELKSGADAGGLDLGTIRRQPGQGQGDYPSQGGSGVAGYPPQGGSGEAGYPPQGGSGVAGYPPQGGSGQGGHPGEGGYPPHGGYPGHGGGYPGQGHEHGGGGGWGRCQPDKFNCERFTAIDCQERDWLWTKCPNLCRTCRCADTDPNCPRYQSRCSETKVRYDCRASCGTCISNQWGGGKTSGIHEGISPVPHHHPHLPQPPLE